jgi:glucose/arabinose dehydrogenase
MRHTDTGTGADADTDADGNRKGNVHRRRVLQTIGGLGVAGMAGTASGRRAVGIDGTVAQANGPSLGSDPAILIVSLTPDFRHESIPAGNQAIRELGDEITQETGTDVTVDLVDSVDDDTPPTEFPTDVSELEGYDVVVFNNTNDANPPQSTATVVLDDEQATAFEEYIRSGGGFVGIHATVDNQTDGSFFNGLMDTYFLDHPEVQEGEIHVTDRTHPSTSHLPAEWELESEWYNFTRNPRGEAHVLCSADESTYNETGYDGGEMPGNDHPMTWCQNVDAGRSWYTALGHLPEQFEDENFRQHLKGGIMWAAGYVDGGATGTVWDYYEKVPLDTETESPSMLDVASDGRVFYIDRRDYNSADVEAVAVIEETDSGTQTTTALELDVYGTNNGLKGMALDPDFADNGWLYLYYAPPSDAIDGAYNRLSRFTVDGNMIDPASEVEMLQVPVQREVVGHYGGDIEFGPEGELYLTTGDATTPFESSGYTPIDERDGRATNDAQRTSANSATLGGSVLRILPNDDGSYSIPEGNLFPESEYADEIEQGLVHPEIYAMGVRNPYRASVDPETGAFYWGDYGPDAGGWNTERGPPAIVEFNRATEPGFYGWPYFVGPNVPFVDYDFATGESGDPFDPQNPTNDSPHNTGLTDLPPSREALLYYTPSWETLLDAPDYAAEYLPDEAPFPQLQSASPMAGPVFRHDDGHDPNRALPASFDGKFFVMDRGANWIKYVSFDDDGDPMEIDPLLPEMEFRRPMDMAVGPDGALYLAEWGSGYEAPNADSGIYRIEHTSVRNPAPSFADGAEVNVEPGTTTVEASLRNTTPSTLESGAVTLSAPDDSDVEISAASGTSFDSLAAGEAQSMSWEVTVPESADGTVTLTATATYTLDGDGIEESSTLTLRVVGGVSAPFGVNIGGEQPVTVDGLEFVTLPAPSVSAVGNPSTSGTEDPIAGTEDDALYQSLQYGSDIGYEVEIENGTYDVALYFVENYWRESGSGDGVVDDAEGQRVFSVSIEDEQVIEELDIYAEVGHDTALTRTVEGVEVTDGVLSIGTTTLADNSTFSGIAIRPSDPLQNGLAAHFTLDGETPTNEVTGTDATISGDVTTGVEGIVGDAYEFDVDQETGVTIDPADATAGDGVTTEPLPLNGAGATAAAWINFTDHEQWARAPFQVGGSLSGAPNGGWNVQFESNENALRSELWDGGSPSNGSGGTPIPVDPETWYFVVMVVDGGDARVHVFDEDGELDASPQTWTGGSRTQSDAAPMTLGVGQGYDMEGRVDEMWAHSRALSESEVADLYARSTDVDDGVIEPGTTIELGGEIPGWVGQAPSSIEGTTNPTLRLQAGAEYTVSWVNLDGAPHDFHVLDSEGNEIDGTGAPEEGVIDGLGSRRPRRWPSTTARSIRSTCSAPSTSSAICRARSSSTPARTASSGPRNCSKPSRTGGRAISTRRSS